MTGTAGYTPDFKFPVQWLYLGDRDIVHVTEGGAQTSANRKRYLGQQSEALSGTGVIDHVAFRCSGLAEFDYLVALLADVAALQQLSELAQIRRCSVGRREVDANLCREILGEDPERSRECTANVAGVRPEPPGRPRPEVDRGEIQGADRRHPHRVARVHNTRRIDDPHARRSHDRVFRLEVGVHMAGGETLLHLALQFEVRQHDRDRLAARTARASHAMECAYRDVGACPIDQLAARSWNSPSRSWLASRSPSEAHAVQAGDPQPDSVHHEMVDTPQVLVVEPSRLAQKVAAEPEEVG